MTWATRRRFRSIKTSRAFLSPFCQSFKYCCSSCGDKGLGNVFKISHLHLHLFLMYDVGGLLVLFLIYLVDDADCKQGLSVIHIPDADAILFIGSMDDLTVADVQRNVSQILL